MNFLQFFLYTYDEFQDCDSEQIHMLKLLSGCSNLFAVGDEDQCIYGFRGSIPDCMVEFERYFNGGVKFFLNKNYRSSSDIIEISRKLISKNKERNVKEMVGVREERGTVTIIKYKTEREQAEGMIDIIKANGFKPSECAVLSRTNQEAEKVIGILIRDKISFRLMDKNYNFFRLDICRDIAAYFRLSQDPCNKESFLRIINKPCRYISKIKIGKINCCKTSENWFSFLEADTNMEPWQLKYIHAFERNTKRLGRLSPEKALIFLLDRIKYKDEVPADKQDVLAEFMDLCKEYKTIPELLTYIDTYNSRLNEDMPDALVLSTIHGSKGLEYKNLFIINCCSDNIPHENSKNNLEEERRLFYVALTRAADNLHIMYPENFKGNKAEPSPFINECM